MQRRQVLMIQTYDQLIQGNRYILTEDLIRFLEEHGYVVVSHLPAGPSETQRVGPSEVKTKKAKKRYGS